MKNILSINPEEDDSLLDSLLIDDFEQSSEEETESVLDTSTENVDNSQPIAAASSLDELFAEIGNIAQKARDDELPTTNTIPIAMAAPHHNRQVAAVEDANNQDSKVDKFRQQLIETRARREAAAQRTAQALAALLLNTDSSTAESNISTTTSLSAVEDDNNIDATTSASPAEDNSNIDTTATDSVEPSTSFVAQEDNLNTTIISPERFFSPPDAEDKTKRQSASQPDPSTVTAGSGIFASKRTPANTSASMSKATNSSWITFRDSTPDLPLSRQVGFKPK